MFKSLIFMQKTSVINSKVSGNQQKAKILDKTMAVNIRK